MEKQSFHITDFDRNTVVFEGKKLKALSGLDACRTIFITKQYVIKFDSHPANIYTESRCSHQCPRENNIWKKIKGTNFEKYFVPILQFGNVNDYDYVVQPRVDRKRRKLSEEHKAKISEAEERFGFYDLGERNVSINKGALQIFDYGLYSTK